MAGLAASLVAVAAPATTAAGDSGRVREVRTRDDCDPATFNAVLGEGACVGDGDTTFDELIGALVADGEHPKWRNAPNRLDARTGDRVIARNTGGEAHTFTEVQAFGGGCVPDLNAILGLTPVPECDDPAVFGQTLVLPSQSIPVSSLDLGTHHFQCLIHPWMHTTVQVAPRR
jgi:hypothetical protein